MIFAEYFSNILSTLRVEPDPMLMEAQTCLQERASGQDNDFDGSAKQTDIADIALKVAQARDSGSDMSQSFAKLKMLCTQLLRNNLCKIR